MKLFKYFSYSEIKEICTKLNNDNCHFRHPKRDFTKCLGEDKVSKLVKMGWLKDSPFIENCHDYYEPCYEFSTFFRKVSNFMTNGFKNWLYYYVFQIWRLKYIKDNLIYKLTGKRPGYYGYAESFYEVES